MAPTRIKGKGLTFEIDSVEYNCDATSVVLEHEETDADQDTVTFCDAASASAGLQWFFTIDAVTSTSTDSLWTYLWDNAGTESVAFTFAPHANATASATEPHFTGTVTLPEKPSIGGQADSTWTFNIRIDLTEGTEPTKEVA